MVDDVFDEVGLKVENLHASYGAVEVLRGLDFEDCTEAPLDFCP